MILTGLCNERKTRIELLTRLGSLATEIYLEGSHKPNPDQEFQAPQENDSYDIRFKIRPGADFLVESLQKTYYFLKGRRVLENK